MDQLVKSEAFISVVTKSKLVLRDIDLLKQMKHVEVVISICLLDENLKLKLEPYSSSIKERLETLKELKQNNIKTIVFISPIIPEITDYKKIIEETKDYTDEYWFDKLNLRNSFKTNMFNFIGEEFQLYKTLYDDIYNKKDSKYFTDLSEDISKYCKLNGITYKDFSAGT